MAKRYTDSRKWDDPWFIDLSLKDKMFWIHILDKCDHAGIYKPNFRLASFLLGESCLEEYFIEKFKGRIEILTNRDWFIPKFILFQYGELDKANRCHKSVIEILKRKGAFKTLARPLQGYKDKEQDKGKGKDKDKGKDIDTKEFPYLKDSNFQEAFNDFLDMRKEVRAKATKKAIKLVLKKLHLYPMPTAISMLEQSTENSWKGVFKLKGEGNGYEKGDLRNRGAKKEGTCGKKFEGIETEM